MVGGWGQGRMCFVGSIAGGCAKSGFGVLFFTFAADVQHFLGQGYHLLLV